MIPHNRRTHDHYTTGSDCDYLPLSRAALDEIITLARATHDYLEGRKLLRRIDQGIEGMVYPRHCARPSVLVVADEARQLFMTHVNDATALAALAKLEALLGLEPILQTPLDFSGDWQPTREEQPADLHLAAH